MHVTKTETELDNWNFYFNSRSLALIALVLFSFCRSPDFKSPTGPTKNLERLYNQVVVWLFGWLVVRLQRWL